ncbi:GNAT family N-acetyltransferase [bacterium]|nr:GNAT family N-acetyltransferase [bacterium]
MEWIVNQESSEWDRNLASINGHPLQSALWGDARKQVDGITDIRFVCTENGEPIFMARVEERTVPVLGKVAWIPRGPAIVKGRIFSEFEKEFVELLEQKGFCLVIHDRYETIDVPLDLQNSAQVKTIWIDLVQGETELKKKLDKQWRYGLNRAVREGVVVEQSRDIHDVDVFFFSCRQVSDTKNFYLPGSATLLYELLNSTTLNKQQATALFLARYEGEIAAGAMVARSGKHVHYLWGMTNRKFSKQRAGEAVQWSVIQWAVAQGCTRYDLEGIDPVNNLGTYQFKKKMGGKVVVLKGKNIYPLSYSGKLIGYGLKMLGKI